MIKFLDLHAQYLSIKPDIDAAIAAVIRDAAFIGGAPVAGFEAAFAEYQHAKYCVGVANGTDAIEIALEALGLPPGGEVITPANSFIASSESITRSGHKVVFADADPHSYTLDPADVERRITPHTCAIVAVHLYGHPCDMEALMVLAARHGLRIIEDCAQAHGAEYKERRVGTLGDIGTFSFYPGKNLGAYGDGGAIVTNDAARAKRCRMIANHGRVEKYDHQFEGRNSRLDALQAAILHAKLRNLDGWVTRRNEVAQRYLEHLRGVGDLVLPTIDPRVRHAFHLFVVRTVHRDALAAHLQTRGVQTGIHYPKSLPKLAAYAYLGQSREDMFSNSSDCEVLSLPMGEHLTDPEIDAICDAVISFGWK